MSEICCLLGGAWFAGWSCWLCFKDGDCSFGDAEYGTGASTRDGEAEKEFENGMDSVVLPLELYSVRERGREECPICLGAFGDGQEVTVLPKCKHFYHRDCLSSWLFRQPTCPLCRCSVRHGPTELKRL
ncbi:RING-H2 finger protein ATL5 [Selaginella moellendorffii]|nr:RING-H2 finger protein ATL5 [Selaginella moellendorffii]|eukprot:XP_002967123.2 RING-H2 finger protein ATL5 [Selaginella moellendorffii]